MLSKSPMISRMYVARVLFPSNIPMSYGRKLLPRTMSVDYVKIKAHGLWQWILIVDDGRDFVQCRVDPQPCTKLFPWNMSICNDHELSPWTMSLNYADGPWPWQLFFKRCSWYMCMYYDPEFSPWKSRIWHVHRIMTVNYGRGLFTYILSVITQNMWTTSSEVRGWCPRIKSMEYGHGCERHSFNRWLCASFMSLV